jgi:inner membrane protein
MWDLWWVWISAALVLAILEIVAPAFIFLGFALGALAVGLLLLLPGIAAWLAGSLPLTLVVFALLSLVAWLVLHKVFALRKGQAKIWHRDINDD